MQVKAMKTTVAEDFKVADLNLAAERRPHCRLPAHDCANSGID
jgi:hypothetical protein